MSKLTPLNLFIRQALLYPLDSPFLPPENKVEEDYSYAAGQKTGSLEPTQEQGIPKTGQTISYADYDDGYYQKGYPLTGPRITDNGDGTLTDNVTGLMWTKTGYGTDLTWSAAMAIAPGLSLAGYTDWRLPNIKELFSITRFGGGYFKIIAGFDDTYDDTLWSSTTVPETTTKAYMWEWITGSVFAQPKTEGYGSVFCVRGGP